MGRYVFGFGPDGTEGDPTDVQRLGGKGAGLAAMVRLGAPVPPGFTISAEVCAARRQQAGADPAELAGEIDAALGRLERTLARRFGDPAHPLLVSVRSGAAVSMPGMMDTILNLGLSSAGVHGLARKTRNPRFAWDAFRRLIQMYGDVVLRVPRERFEHILADARTRAGVKDDAGLSATDLETVAGRYLALVAEVTGAPFPEDARVQLRGAIDAVFRSWDNERAIIYRRAQGIGNLLGTAVTVQAMVFGNMGDDSATGVCFTRDPGTGEDIFYGEYLRNAQGEDVVAGTRTPRPIAELQKELPEPYRQLVAVKDRLVAHYRDLLDLEFTIEGGRLFMLQVRSGKRAGPAAFRIAAEMHARGQIDVRTAVTRVEPEHVEHLLFPVLDPDHKRKALAGGRKLATGLGAGPGAASGRLAFTADEAERLVAAGTRCVLVRRETSPEDIGGMMQATGILTTTGGRTSHAAVVARGLGKCCVVGCDALSIDPETRTLRAGTRVLKADATIALDGFTGEVFEGELPMRQSDVLRALEAPLDAPGLPDTVRHFRQVMGWADAARRLKVRANADTPTDARVARLLGAEGIGLCRTEHMFFAPEERIAAVREMILATGPDARTRALAKLLPMQRDDFAAIFRTMEGWPVTIRLLDPPLHEFLPQDAPAQARLAKAMGVTPEEVERTVLHLHETNPMLGHRGCRLAVTRPEIYDMQTRAILEAAAAVIHEGGQVQPEIMIPLVGYVEELRLCRRNIERVAAAVRAETGVAVPFTVGTMIEVPRAALTARALAGEAEFFSFGTNDLTQMTVGLSRDDAAKFLWAYQEQGIFSVDPFRSLDQDGVGVLIRMATTDGRAARPKLKVGICGEHGGDPASIAFCHAVGLDYVSCSPYRVPVARIAAARASLAKE